MTADNYTRKSAYLAWVFIQPGLYTENTFISYTQYASNPPATPAQKRT